MRILESVLSRPCRYAVIPDVVDSGIMEKF